MKKVREKFAAGCCFCAFVVTIVAPVAAETPNDARENVEITPDGKKFFPDDTTIDIGDGRNISDLHWQEGWGRAGWLEAGIGVGSLATGYGFQYFFGAQESPKWIGGFAMDDSIGGVVRADDLNSMETAAGASDVLLYSLVGFPVLVDAGLAAGLGHGDWDTAGQLGLISLQSFGLTTGLVSIIKNTVGRKRPYEDGDTRSFPSGHAAIAFTGAGLICANHGNLDLFGDGFLNDLPCYVGTAAALTTATLRITAQKHYFSDVLVGSAIGVASGYVLPKLAYFSGTIADTEVAGSVRPTFNDGGAGVKLSLTF